MYRRLRNAFIAGLVLLAPLGVTYFVIDFLRTKIGSRVTAMIPQNVLPPDIRRLPIVEFGLDMAAVLIVVLAITLLGFFSNYFLGKVMIIGTERVIDRVPFINTVYRTVKQIVETFSKQQKAVFQKVVLTEYPRKGVYVLGFLTSAAKGEVQEKTGAEVVNVFVPTTPNPTSGFLLMVPVDEVIEMDMTIADGMKLIVSGGAVSPPYPPPPAPEPRPTKVRHRAPRNLPGPSNHAG
ncbi:DUF502 domain-containing protein [Ruficoccus sp. ZRK36]|uniref:DUF502 domain-containing protein n=1 Tax=Ruficoccus sp. ZRK36 TaxID=2866311 RepID=UPI001C738003|nr:DUF502 domain-containing protein [Ruficoccus sp. ZRK36]QYY34924.1 DUF502 domain-containing protein [Ruficoccus sp. ZRK36]